MAVGSWIPNCDDPDPGPLALRVEVTAGDAPPRQVEVPVVNAASRLQELAMFYRLDLASRVRVRLAGEWRRVPGVAGPVLEGSLEVVAEPPIGVQLLQISSWEPFVISSPEITDEETEVLGGSRFHGPHVRGFQVLIRVGTCVASRPADQALLGIRTLIRASDGSQLDTPVELTTGSAAALVGLYDLVCGDAANQGGLRIEPVPSPAGRRRRSATK